MRRALGRQRRRRGRRAAPTVTAKPRSVPSCASFVAMPSRGAEVRPVQHQQRRVVPLRRRARPARRWPPPSPATAATAGRRSDRSTGAVGPAAHLDPEVVRLDRQRRLDLQLVVAGGRRTRSAAASMPEHERGLLQGELAADAGALPGAERLERVRRQRRRAGSAAKWSGSNSSASSPQTLRSRCSIGVSTVIAVPGGDRVPPADHGVLVRHAVEPRRRRPQPQRLVEDLVDVLEPVHLLVARDAASPPSTSSTSALARARTSGFFSR